MKEIKTGNMYEKLQKELDKGNTVLVEVDLFGASTRYRLVTPKDCEYADDIWSDFEFDKSCFVRNKKNIVSDMLLYDKLNNYFIVKMLVL